MSILTINDPISEEFLISKGFEKHYNTKIHILNVESIRYYTKTIRVRVGKEEMSEGLIFTYYPSDYQIDDYQNIIKISTECNPIWDISNNPTDVWKELKVCTEQDINDILRFEALEFVKNYNVYRYRHPNRYEIFIYYHKKK